MFPDPDVSNDMIELSAEVQLLEVGVFIFRRQRIPGDLGAQVLQPERQPEPLKPVCPVSRTSSAAGRS